MRSRAYVPSLEHEPRAFSGVWAQNETLDYSHTAVSPGFCFSLFPSAGEQLLISPLKDVSVCFQKSLHFFATATTFRLRPEHFAVKLGSKRPSVTMTRAVLTNAEQKSD